MLTFLNIYFVHHVAMNDLTARSSMVIKNKNLVPKYIKRLLVFYLLCKLFLSLSIARGQDGSSSPPTLHMSTSLTLVDVSVEDNKTHLPIKNLTREDFRIRDNGHDVPISTFDSGAHLVRPIALWFVTICNQDMGGDRASRPFAGRETDFRPPLDHLDKTDVVGVAHWCDNGEATIDLSPMSERDPPISALEKVLKPVPFFILPPVSRIGELSAQRVLRLVLRDSHQRADRYLPVIVILHGDYTGAPLPELNRVSQDLLSTSAVVYGIRDSDLNVAPLLNNGEQSQIFRYMAEQTGGTYYSVPPKVFGSALDNLILKLHFRYQLGFKPLKVDGKFHTLSVELIGQAKKENKNVRISARTGYIPATSVPDWENYQ